MVTNDIHEKPTLSVASLITVLLELVGLLVLVSSLKLPWFTGSRSFPPLGEGDNRKGLGFITPLLSRRRGFLLFLVLEELVQRLC